MKMVNKSGLNLVLHLTLCLFLLSANVSDSKAADVQFETQHYHTYLEGEDNSSSVETIRLNDQSTNKNVPERGNSTVPETYQSEKFSPSNDETEKANDTKNGITTEIHPSENNLEYNDISANNTTPDWKPKAIGVATWYEISLTGRRTSSNVGQWVENGKSLAPSSTTTSLFVIFSQISFQFIMKKFIWQQ
ncbi:hypothetical protein J437_LFUL006753 [Ladona fulva]|uniref:Uncharacterized protein n=1 Tax=Ladona fulva TaxID=123851 RepID=A0A8K0NZM4_LADFU|nr:hypothetical protein J437_LFUL006753 [Ladona fulva]